MVQQIVANSQRQSSRRYLFDKSSLHSLLTNPLYVGRIKHKEETFKGEHHAIIDRKVFDAVQTLLKSNSRGKGKRIANKYDALLRGLLVCPQCKKAMVHNVARRNSRVYRYYTCQTAIKRGYKNCPFPTLPAAEMEEAVVDHIRCIASDAELRRDVLLQSQTQSESELEALAAQERSFVAQLSRCHDEIKRMTVSALTTSEATDRMATLHEQVAQVERRLATVRSDAESLREQHCSELDFNAVFADFDNVWNALTTMERIQVLNLLVERVQFDAEDSTIAITLHPSGIKSLTQTMNPEPKSKEAS